MTCVGVNTFLRPEIYCLLFQFRTRMFSVKGNYRNKYAPADIYCDVDGCDEIDSQQHVTSCGPILRHFNRPVPFSYDEIFSNDPAVLSRVGHALSDLVLIRGKLLDAKRGS